MIKKIVFILVLAGVVITSGMSGTVKVKNITIVKNKKVLCRLILPGKSKEVFWGCRGAARDLRNYIYKSSGAKPAIIYGKAPDDKLVNIHVGLTDYVKKIKPNLPSPQGFVIQFPDEKNIIIAGRLLGGKAFAEVNTVYGAHYFLRRYLGVRWLFPGELGEYIPKHNTISIPMVNIVEKPSFFRRQYTGLGKVYKNRNPRLSGMIWGKRHGYISGAGLELNHNIGNIFPPDKYTKTHPEFFPLINGKRFLPKPNPKNKKWRVHNWDACYTAPGIVDEAAKNIIKYFDKNPRVMSYSLSINDGANICQCRKCREKNKIFLKGSSQSYYEWANEVVKKVRKKYPDKYFGLLSYNNVTLPPKNIVLDDHIVPVLCRDLLYWANPEIRKNVDEKRIKAWRKIAPTLGLWDYLFDGAYIVPRTTTSHTAKTLKYLYENGLRFYHGELCPGPEWKNAPQIYLRARLLWNINLDPDKVLKEWYELCVGKKAAPYLEQYYAIWEEFWTKRVIKTDWFKYDADIRPYLRRRELGYLVALKQDDLDKCEKLLAKTCELAGTAKQKRRAKFIQDYFLFAKKKYLEPYIQYVKMSGAKTKSARGLIVQKFDCDKGIKAWRPWQKKHCRAKFYYDKRVGYSKKGSIALDTRNSLPGIYVFRNKVDIISGKKYRVSAMVRTMNMPETAKVTLKLRFLKAKGCLGADINGKRVYQYEDSINGGTKGKWKKLQICFKVPENAWNDVKSMTIWPTISGTNKPNCKVWIDDVTIEFL